MYYFYRSKSKKIFKTEKNWKYNFINENWDLISKDWFDYVYKFNETKWIWKVVLNWKFNFINEKWEIISKRIDRHLYSSCLQKKEIYNFPEFLYRIERIENLEKIISLWFLSRNLAMKYIDFQNNSYDNIQNRRSYFWKYNLHDYVPLFFSMFPPMIYSNKISSNIKNQIILKIDWNILTEKWVLFSDISLAYWDVNENNIFDNLSFLKKFDFSIFNKKWRENDIEIRKKKWAEVLVSKRIDFSFVKSIICFNINSKMIIEDILLKNSINLYIDVKKYEDFR